jgi:hypothetical protein
MCSAVCLDVSRGLGEMDTLGRTSRLYLYIDVPCEQQRAWLSFYIRFSGWACLLQVESGSYKQHPKVFALSQVTSLFESTQRAITNRQQRSYKAPVRGSMLFVTS